MSAYSKVNKRVSREGVYDAYVLHREAVKRLLPKLAPGCKPESLAWRVAVWRFPPKDGSPCEVAMTPQIRSIMAGIPFPTTPDAPGVAESVRKNEPEKLGLPEPPTYKNSKGTELIHYEQQLKNQESVAAILNTHEAWEKLHAAIDRTKKSKPFDMIQWVFEHLKVRPDLIDPEEVPSAGAAAYLQDCQESPTVRAAFMDKLYSKTIPDKRQLEHDAKGRDDGRQVLSKLDAFDAEFESDPDILKMGDVA